jgi:predicted transcriptional regulator of viral defense system
VAAEQGGYFTAAQAKEVGHSYQAQAHHVGGGNWHRVDRGLFRLAEWSPGPHDDLARWTLWSRGRAVVSHETALAVHEIGEFESPHVRLTVPPGFTARHAAVHVHVGELSPGDIVDGTGYRMTTPLRSLVDIAADADEQQLARAIADAAGRGLLTVRRLRDRAEAVDPRAALHIERALHRSDA